MAYSSVVAVAGADDDDSVYSIVGADDDDSVYSIAGADDDSVSVYSCAEDNLMEWKELFTRIHKFLTDCERNKDFLTCGKAEYVCERLENIIITVRQILQGSGDSQCDASVYLIDHLSSLNEYLSTVELSHLKECLELLLASSEGSFCHPTVIKIPNKRGRPPFDLDAEQILCFMKWDSHGLMLRRFWASTE